MEQLVQQVQTRPIAPVHRHLQLYPSLFLQDIKGTNKAETLMNKAFNPSLYQETIKGTKIGTIGNPYK